MKSLIICFSQSGNTQKIAERIREGVVETTGQCDITALADVDASALKNYDLVGLGCPVFYCQEPFNVRDFIDDLPEMKNKHWFVFCTHGSIMGTTLVSMSERLMQKGALVAGHFDSYADGTLLFYPHPMYTSGHPDAIDLEQAREFGKDVAERSRRIAAGDKGLVSSPKPVDERWVRSAAQFSPENLEHMMKPFSLDMDKCTRCGECEANCPVGGIDIEAEPPRLQEPCIYCYRCTIVCPAMAIEFDWERMAARNKDSFAMYRRELEEAEAKGEFRWLVDPDSINLDDPLYKQRRRKLKADNS
jgi:flavodoxin/ferredoxin